MSSENQDPVYNVTMHDIVSDCNSDLELEWRTSCWWVVQLDTLANGLKACQLCNQPLHLVNTVGKRKFGLTEILEVKCMYSECGCSSWKETYNTE